MFTYARILSLLLLWSLTAGAASFAPRFLAFQNGLGLGSPEKDARLLKEIGYDGVCQVFDRGEKLAERVAAYDRVGLPVLSVYLNVYDQPIPASDVQPLANRGAMIELTIRKMTPQTVAAVRQTAEMAEGLNIKVALYPHFGFAVAAMPQAMELMEKVNHPNLGVMFNLCHFLKSEKAEDMEKILKAAGDRLFAVSTSGADLNGKSWATLIQPLDQGDFPQERLFRHLKKLNFEGPVGLQCYGIKGDKPELLKRSFTAWSKILQNMVRR